MAAVELMKKIVPFVTCEVTFGQTCLRIDVWCEAPNLNLGVQINSVKQPIQSNMSHCRTSAFYYHPNHGFSPQKCRTSHQIRKTSRSTKHDQHYSIQESCWVGTLV